MRFALVAPEDVVIGRIDCSSFRPMVPIEAMKMAEPRDGLRHVLELYGEGGRLSYEGPLPYMAQVNAIGFLGREHSLAAAKRGGYRSKGRVKQEP